MNPSRRPLSRALLISACSIALLVSGCGSKKPISKNSGNYTPPPSSVKPTATLTADKPSINPGDTVRLSWTTTDAPNVSIAPEIGAVTAQGSTSVTPGASTTYTLTASGSGGNTDATVRITVSTPTVGTAPVSSNTGIDQLFLEEVGDAYFDYDSAEIRPDAKEALRKSADFFKKYPTMRITIEGHCDERGSTEYNLALGDRRANAVKSYLVGLGIPGDRLNTVSYGKEKPFCMEADEGCYTKNRRGHFVQAK
jgi:peptidoglycan-associated lipoprotein